MLVAIDTSVALLDDELRVVWRAPLPSAPRFGFQTASSVVVALPDSVYRITPSTVAAPTLVASGTLGRTTVTPLACELDTLLLWRERNGTGQVCSVDPACPFEWGFCGGARGATASRSAAYVAFPVSLQARRVGTTIRDGQSGETVDFLPDVVAVECCWSSSETECWLRTESGWTLIWSLDRGLSEVSGSTRLTNAAAYGRGFAALDERGRAWFLHESQLDLVPALVVDAPVATAPIVSFGSRLFAHDRRGRVVEYVADTGWVPQPLPLGAVLLQPGHPEQPETGSQ